MGNNDYSVTEKLDIRIDKAIVPWAFKACPKYGKYAGITLMPGWALPGGERTTDRYVATQAALKINELILEGWKMKTKLEGRRSTIDDRV